MRHTGVADVALVTNDMDAFHGTGISLRMNGY